MKSLIAVVGPTATGKSSLAIKLAEKFGGEVVGADSRQVYRYMDIGTAKLSPEELSRVKHHLVDVIDPDSDFSLAEYQRMAYRAIDDIHSRGKLPVVAGGSGLYVWAVLEGWVIPEVPPDAGLRRSLEGRAANGEADKIYRELAEIDPEAAERIDKRNVRRLVRALEVSMKGDGAFSQMQGKKPPPYDILIIGLTAERKELYKRIDDRVDIMIERGLVDEVKKLVDMDYRSELPSMSGIGYREIGMYLDGEITLEEAARKIKTSTHRFVRRQYNWFSLADERIHWFDIGQDIEPEVMELVKGLLEK
jgi:tRNA dimethylallyltransferase